MLTKNVDQVVIGKSTFSLLLGLQLLQSGSNVLLLDDDRIGYGELYERFLSEVTTNALKAWGEELSVSALANIDQYLSPTTQVIHLSDHGHARRVRLSQSPWANMLELSRKLGYPTSNYSLPDKETFNQEALESLQRLGRHLYQFQALSALDAKTLIGQLPKELVAWGEPIVAPYLGRKQLDLSRPWDAFFYVARAIFHHKFSLDFSAAEVWHLLIEAIAPRFELDSDTLVRDLVDVYQLRGGQFKSTRVREWMFYKSSPWSLELSSYEGIIHPKKLVLMGSHCSPVGLEMDAQGPEYLSVRLGFEAQKSVLAPEEIHFHFNQKDVGTDFGLWSVRQRDDLRIDVDVAIRKREGMKIEFMSKQLLSRSKALLDDSFSLAKATVADVPMVQGRELWIDEHFHKPRRLRGELLLPVPAHLRQVLAPGETERVKNVSYFGPARRDRLGLISSLIDMKDSLPRLQ